MNPDEARDRFAGARVARLATVDGVGRPFIVPVVFIVDGDTILSAVDDKPKRSSRLRRLENIASNPRVAVLVDEYYEDWNRLWWARADGLAEVLDKGSERSERALDLLVERYPPYRLQRPGGPVISIGVVRWSGWAASP